MNPKVDFYFDKAGKWQKEIEKLTDDTSRLNMQMVFRTPALRDQMLKLPFRQGLNMAHDRLQKVVNKLK